MSFLFSVKLFLTTRRRWKRAGCCAWLEEKGKKNNTYENPIHTHLLFTLCLKFEKHQLCNITVVVDTECAILTATTEAVYSKQHTYVLSVWKEFRVCVCACVCLLIPRNVIGTWAIDLRIKSLTDIACKTHRSC